MPKLTHATDNVWRAGSVLGEFHITPVAKKMARLSENAERPLIGDERWLVVVYLVMIQITVNEGRTIELKKALYKAIAEDLQKLAGLKPQDVFISLVEVKKENRSFENGLAQHAP